MASFPCSIHSELCSSSSSMAVQRTRLSSTPSSSPSPSELSSSTRWPQAPFLALATTPDGLRGFYGGGGRLAKLRYRGIEARGGICSFALGGCSQSTPFRNAGRSRRTLVLVNSEGPISEEAGAAAKPPETAAEKRPALTAREKLRAARALSKYADTKTAAADAAAPPRRAAEFGSKVLEAMRETDGGKRRSGLPEAPSNMLDDSQRGLSKGGFSFDFPGRNDVLLIAFSFVFISSVMFATTFVVWKLGAIHFNEY